MRRTAFAYLASYTLSILGNAVAAVALPLIVLVTTGSVMGAGVVAAATAIPAFAAGLTMGAVIDRHDRRAASITADLVSAAALALLALIDLVGDLSLAWFIACGILGSFGDVPGLTARDALIPAVARASGVRPERLIGTKEACGAVAALLGPAAAGALMSLLDGSAVLWVTAATSFAAAVVTLALPRSTGRPVPDAVVTDPAPPHPARPVAPGATDPAAPGGSLAAPGGSLAAPGETGDGAGGARTASDWGKCWKASRLLGRPAPTAPAASCPRRRSAVS
ncbi:MAG: MFS transporter [Bifidobacteriaceae bacterium]|jgi:MFS family permease|nr:MFS transporter [Bifidobacteriaceae bacterium]